MGVDSCARMRLDLRAYGPIQASMLAYPALPLLDGGSRPFRAVLTSRRRGKEKRGRRFGGRLLPAPRNSATPFDAQATVAWALRSVYAERVQKRRDRALLTGAPQGV